MKIVKNLEDEILVLQKRLQESEKAVAKLQKGLKEKDESISSITKKNLEYRDKVSEAIEVVHAALNEKDAALFREKEAKGSYTYQSRKTILSVCIKKRFLQR